MASPSFPKDLFRKPPQAAAPPAVVKPAAAPQPPAEPVPAPARLVPAPPPVDEATEFRRLGRRWLAFIRSLNPATIHNLDRYAWRLPQEFAKLTLAHFADVLTTGQLQELQAKALEHGFEISETPS